MIASSTVRRIADVGGEGVPVVSMYVNIPPNREESDGVHPRTHDLLAQVRPMTEDGSVPRAARLSLREDVSRLHAEALRGEWRPPAVAVFACRAKDFLEVVQLPRGTRDRIIVDDDAWIRPLVAILDEDHPTCIAIVDRKSARIWELRQDQLVEKQTIEDRALRKPNYAGWYGLREHTVAHKAEELARRHYLHVGRVLEQLLDSDGYELVVVGGHDEDVPQFVEFLPRAVRVRVAGTFGIDPATATRGDLRKQVQAIIEHYEREEEQRRVADVLERAAAGRPAAVGVRDCLWAASFAAVQELVVQDDVLVPGVVCATCGWLGESGATCPVDGTPTRETPDVLDELVETVLDDSGAVEHVQSDTPIRTHLAAAALRFAVPPAPELVP